MPDFFISHSTKDQHHARQVQAYLAANGASAFLAPFSIQAGAEWSKSILTNLRESKVVLFLASRAACASPFVNQELGGAAALNKHIIPVVWDMSPSELPGWTNTCQAVDLSKGHDGLKPVLDSIVGKLKLDEESKSAFLLIGGIGFLVWLFSDKK